MMLIMVDQPATSPSTPAPPAAGRWLSAAEAAAALNVQERSLYAYVSRGMVRSVPGPSGRRRLYSGEDLDRLRARHDARSGHGPVAAGALQFGEAVLDSAITEITAGGPSYRGYLASELARRGVPFENVAELLWSGALCDGALRWPQVEPLRLAPAAAPATPATSARAARAPAAASRKSASGSRAAAKSAMAATAATSAGPGGGRTVADALLAVPLALAPADPERDDARADAMMRCGRRLIPQLALASNPWASAADRQRAASADGIAASLAALWRLPARAAAALDAALVMIADHELNASTFAARVAAGTGADPYAVVTAALAALSGPRHGTAAIAAGRFLAEVGKPTHAVAAVRALRQRHQVPPGFGHRVYTGVDPRAQPLFELADKIAPDHPLVRTAHAVIAAVAKDGAYPNVDVAQVALAAALGAPLEMTTAWFAVGRCAGWLAHATEQRTSGALVRPRARYTGPASRALQYTAVIPTVTTTSTSSRRR